MTAGQPTCTPPPAAPRRGVTRRSSWRYSYSSLAGDTHTQAKPVLKSIEYLLILILIARIGNHTHDYLSIQVLSCHPSDGSQDPMCTMSLVKKRVASDRAFLRVCPRRSRRRAKSWGRSTSGWPRRSRWSLEVPSRIPPKPRRRLYRRVG